MTPGRGLAKIGIMLVSSGLLPAMAHARRLGGGDDLNISLGRIVAALIICLLIAGLAILLIRQRSGRIDIRMWLTRFQLPRRTIEVVETRRLSPHADICAVRHSGQEYLLLLAAGHVEVLNRMPVPFAPEDQKSPTYE